MYVYSYLILWNLTQDFCAFFKNSVMGCIIMLNTLPLDHCLQIFCENIAE